MRDRKIQSQLLLSTAAVLIALAFLWGGCSETTPGEPSETPINELVAHYMTADFYEESGIELNGERLDSEWGSPFTVGREFLQVRLSSENGRNNPGPPLYISMKAVYTEQYIFLLAQWADDMPNSLKDQFIYVGPSLSDPIVTCVDVGGVTVCDSLYREGDVDSLTVSSWWSTFGDDDKFALAFQMSPASGNGGTFDDIGCQVACHGSSQDGFGALDEGRLDLWYWMAGRTNPARNKFYPLDPADDPIHGVPGYFDDLYFDQLGGLIPDEGQPCFCRNTYLDENVPRYVYRIDDDIVMDRDPPRNRWLESGLPNNGIDQSYLWREKPTVNVEHFGPSDVDNESVMPDPRPWVTYDMAPGYWLTYPSESRADVRGQGNFDDDNGIWVLEIARKLNTNYPNQDVIFDPDSGERYAFTVSLFNGTTEEHWGSETQYLTFGSRSDTEE